MIKRIKAIAPFKYHSLLPSVRAKLVFGLKTHWLKEKLDPLLQKESINSRQVSMVIIPCGWYMSSVPTCLWCNHGRKRKYNYSRYFKPDEKKGKIQQLLIYYEKEILPKGIMSFLFLEVREVSLIQSWFCSLGITPMFSVLPGPWLFHLEGFYSCIIFHNDT